MQTKKIGQILSEARQDQRLTLSQLAARTKIKLEYLQALEKNQFEKLPGAVYIKGFIKSYARELKLDPQSLLAILRRDYQEETTGQLSARAFSSFTTKRHRAGRPIPLAIMIVVTIFLTLFGYVSWQWLALNRPPPLEIYSPQEGEFVSSQITIAGSTSPEAIVSVNAQPVSIAANGLFQTEIYLPREGISTITIEATDKRGKTNLQQRTVYVRF